MVNEGYYWYTLVYIIRNYTHFITFKINIKLYISQLFYASYT